MTTRMEEHPNATRVRLFYHAFRAKHHTLIPPSYIAPRAIDRDIFQRERPV
ncbi:MAG TPA: hypothetical protein VFA17_08545 [Thermoplasmata archaeon]|nr:hypothetical protein [Thermoplasmata archaeon]